MKKLTSILIVAAVVFIAACSPKKEEASKEGTTNAETASEDEWPEMDAYHFAMAEAFHPFKDSANLAPVKAQAADLVKAAETWVNAPLPEKVNNDEIKTKLQELKAGSDALAQLVSTGTDAEIGASLTALHDKFHELQEAWYGGGGHQHNH